MEFLQPSQQIDQVEGVPLTLAETKDHLGLRFQRQVEICFLTDEEVFRFYLDLHPGWNLDLCVAQQRFDCKTIPMVTCCNLNSAVVVSVGLIAN